MITYDVYVEGKRNGKVMTLDDGDIVNLIRTQLKSLFPENLTIVTTVTNVKTVEIQEGEN